LHVRILQGCGTLCLEHNLVEPIGLLLDQNFVDLLHLLLTLLALPLRKCRRIKSARATSTTRSAGATAPLAARRLPQLVNDAGQLRFLIVGNFQVLLDRFVLDQHQRTNAAAGSSTATAALSPLRLRYRNRHRGYHGDSRGKFQHS
jgi:hypothetical protein